VLLHGNGKRGAANYLEVKRVILVCSEVGTSLGNICVKVVYLIVSRAITIASGSQCGMSWRLLTVNSEVGSDETNYSVQKPSRGTVAAVVEAESVGLTLIKEINHQ
jgi:hypothetical protein